jgi:hypothetical protein
MKNYTPYIKKRRKYITKRREYMQAKKNVDKLEY